MKKLAVATTLTVFGLIVYGVAAYAQPAKVDPVKVDPKHYKVQFENESVRVLAISYAPGEKSVMHYHPNSVVVFVTDAKTRMTTPDGKSEVNAGKAGDALWTPAGNHLPQSMDDKPFRAVLVEMKK